MNLVVKCFCLFLEISEPDVGNRLFAWTRLVLERQIRSGVQEIDTFSVCVCWGGRSCEARGLSLFWPQRCLRMGSL